MTEVEGMGYEAEIRQPLERAAWEQREIYAHLGLALYFCQVVEAALVTHLPPCKGRPRDAA